MPHPHSPAPYPEKTLATELGISTPRFWHIRNAAGLAAAMDELQAPAILKTCQLGYDGKGQVRMSPQDDTDAAIATLNSDDAILEEMIEFDCEISCLIVRDRDGQHHHFLVSQNRHEAGILAQSVAASSSSFADAAIEATAALADLLNLGVLAVEFFISRDGRLLFNEMAPRPHNSFHGRLKAVQPAPPQLASTLPTAFWRDTSMGGRWQMDNLLGQHMAQVPDLLATPGVHLHLYGKPQARTGRKMGTRHGALATEFFRKVSDLVLSR